MTAAQIATRAFYMAERAAELPLFQAYAASKNIDIIRDGLRVSMNDFVDFAETADSRVLAEQIAWFEEHTERPARECGMEGYEY